jgi:hypothetical protein
MFRFINRIIDFLNGESAEQTVAEFQEKFPGECMLCSYHRFGVREGYVKPGTQVKEHDCIEKEKKDEN